MKALININIFLLTLAVVACSPTVKVQAPDKPIEINLNVKIEQRVKIELEKDVKQAISKNPNIF
jgi:YnbE-like lipoprotein